MFKLDVYEITEQSTSYKSWCLKVLLALHMLHCLLYPLEMSILAQIVHGFDCALPI